jgi:hypothetical protein
MATDGKLDTGTGGFSIDGDMHTYDVGVKQDADPPAKTKWSSGDISVDGSNPDLSKSTKRTLASYLSKTSMGIEGTGGAPRAANFYPVSHTEGEEPTPVTLTDNFGSPVSPTPTSNASAFDKKLPDTKSSAAANLNVKKGREFKFNTTVDGNDLLRQAPDPDSEVSKYTNALLVNRFGGNYETAAQDQLGLKQFSTKYKSGVSAPADDSKNVSFGQLAQVGTTLSIRAGLELKSTSDGVNPSTGGVEAGALLPGVAQLGLSRIEKELLEASDVLKTLTESSISEHQLIKPASLSWGTLNNALDHYSGASNFGMQLLSISLVATLGVSIGAITGLLALFKPPFGVGSSKTGNNTAFDALGRYPIGSSTGRGPTADPSNVGGLIKSILQGSFNFWEMIGIKKTIHPTEQCVITGALAFFGFEGDSFLSALASGALHAAQNPGYDSVVARSVNRSFLQIGDAMSRLVDGFKTNIMSGVKNFFALIDVFRESKFIRAVNVFAQLGDQILLDNPDYVDRFANNGAGPKTSAIDATWNVNAQVKNRLRNSTRLAWSSYRSPDMLILPASVRKAQADAAGGRDSALSVPSMMPSILYSSDANYTNSGLKRDLYVQESSGRIPTEIREAMESALDAEYMPFYFHDLRTNEIVSFHAFLTSLSDGLAATYEASDGQGRVEAVKTYKSTARKLGFSFYVAATSQEDFDSMWLKINKLTTLMYPQFTEGKMIKTDNYTMRAPFSQLIGAPPMCRVRIGDLIQSNYSKFNLARLFGYSYGGTKFNGAEITPPNAGQLESYQKYQKEELKNSITESGNSFIPKSIKGPSVAPSSIAIIGNPPPPIDAKVYHPKGLIVDIDKELDDMHVLGTVRIAKKNEIDSLTDDDIAQARFVYDNSKNPKSMVVGNSFSFLKSELTPTNETLKKADTKARTKAGIPEGDYAQNAAEFMNDNEKGKGNVIAKSFRSAGGKGIAGFIEGMDFDWYDRMTWEIDPGKKAPKGCKITITFSPIHDIAPGLDHEGSNRAPIYPIGPLANKGR